ncbi:hypothetical protein HJC23_001813 [Cyclotella cryptica]|uniref:Uncharacterized protein n=1 Tax=Cyclotella cryptica TaxID=29204 RepID=A0ABD3PJA5_9STRA
MSRPNGVKTNSSRLPPKTTALPRKMPNSNKNGTKANKAVIEKENRLREELISTLTEQTENLVDILEAGGVPKYPCLDEIKMTLLSCSRATENGGKSQVNDVAINLEQANNAVDQAFSYAECYHAIDIDRLVSVLDEVQSVIVDLARLSKKAVQRKLMSLQNDSKADHSVLSEAEDAASQIESIVVKCTSAACRTRALKLCL